MDRSDIASIETEAYRARWDDGLFDLFFGLSLAWMGIAWLWIEPLAGLAGVFPAIFVVPFVSFRKRFIESRAGYVRFSEGRRRWERRNLVMLFAFGTGTFLLGIGAILVVDAGGDAAEAFNSLAPGLISFLLALGVLIVAVASMLPRLFVYAAALVIGGFAAVATDANPGAPLLAIGVLVAGWGSILLARFIARHPSITESVV
mgnify:FL=1